MTSRVLSLAACLSIVLSISGVTLSEEGGGASGTARKTLLVGPTLGWIQGDQEFDPTVVLSNGRFEQPVAVRLTAIWAEVERTRGDYDWTEVERSVSRLHAAGAVIILCLTGSNGIYLEDGAPPAPYTPGSMEAWTAFVRSAVRVFGDKVAVYEIWDGPADQDGDGTPAYRPEVYAYLLKHSSLAVRAEARDAGVEVYVSQGPLREGAMEWQRKLWESDTAPYMDILPVRISSETKGEECGAILAEVMSEALHYPPAPAMSVYVLPGNRTAYGTALSALTSAASLVLAPLGGDRLTDETSVRWVTGVQGALSDGFAPAPVPRASFRDSDGNPESGAEIVGSFFSEGDFTAMLAYDPSGVDGRLEHVHVVLPTTFVRNARTIDPVSGQALRTAALEVEGQGSSRTLRLPVKGYPMLLAYQAGVVSPGLDVQEEELDIRRSRGLTAEEIIARYREVQKIQDDNLERWIAKARIDFHVKIAQAGSTIDVGIDSNYFWERGGQVEWEQTDYYVNGNPVRWKNIPEIPLVQPEKVITLPLDLTLDKTYTYSLKGEGRVEGRLAYILEFEPVGAAVDDSMYRGRVWIDKETFARVKASVMQTNLEAPVLSNEEVDSFRVETAADGETYRMLDHIDGQQLWTAGGRNLVVRREVHFHSYEINPDPDRFEEVRRKAYESNNQVLRDTENGFRYLERGEDGSRTVKETMDTSQLFAAAGAFKDSSTDGVTPLAGVNWFDFDFADRNIQVNVLFGGVVGFLNATKPDLFGKRIDGVVEAAGVAIKFDDNVYSGDRELEEERIRTRVQNLSLRLGIPVGQFFKVSLIGDMTFRSYFEDSDAQALLDANDREFRLPSDHTVIEGSIEAEYNRRGYTLAAAGSWAKRSEWEEWGLYDNSAGTYLAWDDEVQGYLPSEPAPVRDSFSKWSLVALKEWYLPRFQKVRGEINYLDGSDLDRFSRYEFSLFGDDRLSGFAGSGVRFDRGAIFRAGYSFNLFDAIRLDAVLETASVENEGSMDGSSSFTGLGLSGNVVGPWKTVINLSYGRALASDIPDLEGEQEFLLFIFKLF